MGENHMQEDSIGDSNDDTLELQNKAGELKEIARDMRYLLVAVSELRRDFNIKIQTDDSKEQLINKLNEELQLYHNDVYIPALRAILIDLITLYDDLNSVIENTNATLPETPEAVLHMLIAFQGSVVRILERNEVNPFILQGDVFIPARQRALHISATNDRQKDHRIARRVRMGFECRSRVLRPELVDIYKYVAPVTQKEPIMESMEVIDEW
jgi:molecular chaperone GrpE